jgi:hypothetical protein
MEASPDRSAKRSAVWTICTAVSIGAALAGVFWYWANGELRLTQNAELRPIAALLQEDQELLKELQTNAALETNSGILASYIAMIRADGVPKHAEMKQRLDRLAENNSAIVALINVYAPRAKTETFKAEADKFSHYAIAWRDRWNSVMELFMAGGNYPVAETPFPNEFLAAVAAEMESTRHAM